MNRQELQAHTETHLAWLGTALIEAALYNLNAPTWLMVLVGLACITAMQLWRLATTSTRRALLVGAWIALAVGSADVLRTHVPSDLSVAQEAAERTALALDPTKVVVTSVSLHHDDNKIWVNFGYVLSAPNGITVPNYRCISTATTTPRVRDRWSVAAEDSLWSATMENGKCSDMWKDGQSWSNSSAAMFTSVTSIAGPELVQQFVRGTSSTRFYFFMTLVFKDALGSKATTACVYADRVDSQPILCAHHNDSGVLWNPSR